MIKYIFYLLAFLSFSNLSLSQPWNDKTHLTHQDTLRGSITPERKWWDVLYYDIAIQPFFNTKQLVGQNIITYRTLTSEHSNLMQIDLQNPLNIDSIVFNKVKKVTFTNEGNVWLVKLPKQNVQSVNSISIFYSGKPHEAAMPPWDGGWVWKTDSLKRPWMTVACQGIGASIWYPCKDYQGDEPDNGTSLTMTVPDTLVAVANGRLKYKKLNNNQTITYKWAVSNTINNYNICPYIGKYVNISTIYKGLKGNLDLSYWVLDYNYEKAKVHLIPQVNLMMKSFEHWFGAYPFYDDGYKLVDAPNYGMEHQSGIAYGNGYQNGNHGVDYSGTGWGMKWDFLIVHESAHEWFGNSITAKDPADKWIQESFACYADVLYMKDCLGDPAANEYVIGTRKNIHNDEPIIGPYNVGKEGANDMYPKGRNMLHIINQIINNDEKFRQILIGINRQFYHQTITSKQIEEYINLKSGIDFSKIFNQYLRTTLIPTLEYKITNKVLAYRFVDCNKDFSMPIKVWINKEEWITPTTEWKKIKGPDNSTFLVDKNFYINIKKINGDN